MPKVNLHLQNMNLTEVKSVKMKVLLPFKVLQIHRRENNTNSIKLIFQAVSQLEFGRGRQYRCSS